MGVGLFLAWKWYIGTGDISSQEISVHALISPGLTQDLIWTDYLPLMVCLWNHTCDWTMPLSPFGIRHATASDILPHHWLTADINVIMQVWKGG